MKIKQIFPRIRRVHDHHFSCGVSSPIGHRIGRVASVTSTFTHISLSSATWTLICLRLPLCRRRSPNTLGKFNCCSGSSISTSDANVFRASRNNRTGINYRAVVNLNCGENGIAHVNVTDCSFFVTVMAKNEGMLISLLFTNPINALSLLTQVFQTPLPIIDLSPLPFRFPFPCFSCPFPAVPFLLSHLTDVSLRGISV